MKEWKVAMASVEVLDMTLNACSKDGWEILQIINGVSDGKKQQVWVIAFTEKERED